MTPTSPMRFIQWRTICGRDSAILLADVPFKKKPNHDDPVPILKPFQHNTLDQLMRHYPRVAA